MLEEFWIHNVTLTRYMGAGSLGDVYDEPEPSVAFVAPGERMYRTSEGREKLATGTVFLPATVKPPALQSEITCTKPGLHGKIAQVNAWDGGELGLPECIELVID